jgi:opacity protein-like surface antigen
MKKLLILSLFMAIPVALNAQKIAIKTNLLYDATATLNIGAEFSLSDRWTVDIPVNYNALSFGDARWKHWMVQPEARLWTCKKFNGHFFGVHFHYADYNVGGMSFLSDNMKNYRYQGHLYGAGVSWGYQWLIGKRWNLEATVGVGYARLDDKKLPAVSCGSCLKERHKNYWGPTKLGLSLMFFIK